MDLPQLNANTWGPQTSQKSETANSKCATGNPKLEAEGLAVCFHSRNSVIDKEVKQRRDSEK
jgi:hypothetical protein